jgi:diguanylate cyclase (GGDEF)-like protein
VLGASRGEDAVPVLAIAGSRKAALAALRSGASDALCTPLDGEEGAARVEALLRGKHAHDRLRDRAQKLERLALTDSLTGLGNRRLFDTRLRQELSRAQRFRDPLALLLVDLDHFKKVNDTYGHPVGDEVLCAASAALVASVRSIDVVCRYGGEEFALVLPRTPLAGSLAVAQRVCHAVSQVRVAGQDALRISASVGVAAFPGEDVQGEQDLVRACDSALYRAKRSGRNCVCIWPAEDAFVLPPTRPGEGARA